MDVMRKKTSSSSLKCKAQKNIKNLLETMESTTKPASSLSSCKLPSYTKMRQEYESSCRSTPRNATNTCSKQTPIGLNSYSSDLSRFFKAAESWNNSSSLRELHELQKFRLNHIEDCFSKQRQLDMKIDAHIYGFDLQPQNQQQPTIPIEKKLTTYANQMKPMPYSMRQRILRQRLDDEERSANKRRNVHDMQLR